MKNRSNLLLLILVLFFSSCATYNSHIKSQNEKVPSQDKKIEHSFYLIGDAGNSSLGAKSAALEAFQNDLKEATKSSTAIFLGDNIYPKGLPGKKK